MDDALESFFDLLADNSPEKRARFTALLRSIESSRDDLESQLELYVNALDAASLEQLVLFMDGLEALLNKSRGLIANTPQTPNAQASSEVADEDPLAKFKAQYEALPKGNILAEGSTWKTVQTRLSDPRNADKLKKVQEELQGGGRLYAVMEDGSLEFVDDNSETPPMFVKDNKTGELQVIYNCNEEEMAAARQQIDTDKTHLWANAQEMLDWAKANDFGVFEADTEDERYFGKEMKLAEAASPNELFVGKKDGPWIATALKDARRAYFDPYRGRVLVYDSYPGYRGGGLGLLRRLRV